ncbi:hypothetical protein [Actinoplanes sp. CA-252034]|uniref:hypothetical protein n=1 Tax=Actinoplanes sp. CA-252034 TaxID=3239906 RepID=UPI003D955BC5
MFRRAWRRSGAIGLAGTAAGLIVRTITTGGMFGWFEDRGWPFAWLGRGAVADGLDEARRQAVAEGWALDPTRLVVDVIVWAYAGLVLICVLGLAVRAQKARGNPERPE